MANPNGMRVIAHRGASAAAPENTLAAFRRAVELGASFIETDLRLSRDAQLVAMHDRTLNRTTNGHGRVSARTLDELRQLDAGSWFRPRRRGRWIDLLRVERPVFPGERIPTVEEVLAFGREHDIGLYLQLKDKGPSGAEAILAGALRTSGGITRNVVISHELRALETIRAIEPLIATGYLFRRKTPDLVAHAAAAGVRHLLPRVNCLTPALVAEAHRQGLDVAVWTVDDPARMRSCMAAGVDGILTNVPDKLVALLAGA